MLNTKSLILCALFSALTAIGAFIKIPIPPLPITLQFLFTTLAGLLLGSKLGTISVLIYLGLGLLGIPIFIGGGGISYILKPTFGYLIGFSVASFVTGLVVEKSSNLSFKTLFIACFAGLIVLYVIGMIYYCLISSYYLNSPINIAELFLTSSILTLPGDIIKCLLSVLIAKRLIPILKVSY